MARIFLGLAIVSIVLLLLSLGVGYWVQDFSETVQHFRDAQQQVEQLKLRQGATDSEMMAAHEAVKNATLVLEGVKRQRTFHTLLGIAAALVTVLVSSISVTYFIGTSRWCQEVVEAYNLDTELIRRSRALKRSAFPWALGCMLVIVAVALTGPFADLASSAHVWLKSTALEQVTVATWVDVHAWVSILATVFVAVSFFFQLSKIARNYVVIDEILAGVSAVREKRGLQQGQPAETGESASEKAP